MVLTLTKVGNCGIFSLLPASIHFVPQRKYRYLVTPLLEPWNICHSFTLSISANHSIHFSYYYFERSAIRSLGIRKTRWFQFHLFLIWCSSFLSDPHHFFFFMKYFFWHVLQGRSTGNRFPVFICLIKYLFLSHFWRITSLIQNSTLVSFFLWAL